MKCPFFSKCTRYHGHPSCVCQECDHINGTDPANKVCGTNYQEYESECHLKLEVCQYQIAGLSKQNDGPCSQDCVYEGWTRWSDCDADCGTAYSTRTRGIEKQAVGNGRPCNLTREDKIMCNLDACPGTACALNNTCGHFEVCVSDKVGDEIECKCPTCEVTGQQVAVCGSDGHNYQSECHLRMEACYAKKRLTVERYGPCADTKEEAELPLMCTVVKKMVNVTVDGCFPEQHDVGMCSGGCASMESYCCKPRRTRIVEKKVPCFDSTVKTTEVEEVTSCVCRCMEDDLITPPDYSV